MSNGTDPIIVCCLTGVCCPPASAEQRAEWVKYIKKQHPHLNDEQAGKRADRVLKKHDYFRDVAKIMDEEA